MSSHISRQAFLAGLSSTFALSPLKAVGATFLPTRVTQRWLYLQRETREGQIEHIDACWQSGEQWGPGYGLVCAIMRDEGVDVVEGWRQIDGRLLLMLTLLQQHVWRERMEIAQRNGTKPDFPPIFVQSAYRTWKTNREAGGVPNSEHLKGKACDFHIPGYESRRAYDFLDQLSLTGGLGWYPVDTPEGAWMHTDSGPQGRRWTG